MGRAISKGRKGRDAAGRFAKGEWKGGPGNPHLRRLGEHQRAVREAVTPEDLRRLLQKLYRQGISGDVRASQVLLERTLGRPHQAPSEDAVEFDLPPLETAEDVRKASAAIARAAARGEITLPAAAMLSALVDQARRAIETSDHDVRLRALEDQA